MRLTLYTDYALRALIYLGLRQDRRVSIREIATAHRISENHLVKVVHQLGRGGFVETTRGKGGGLRLARAPEEIRIGDVVRFTEEDMALVACFQPTATGGGCALINACRLQSLLGEALAGFMAVLDSRTLADLLGPPHRQAMAARLGLAPAGPGQPPPPPSRPLPNDA
ncbi:Rrf2 family transcriptional regulator [Pseudoroseomonas wenyumeiae]|uniref:Rrf2 family transcriptional regulator n=1 Tax=Teichococcus wenyumeiae TaxID=2478470 RepID=A0A3A9JLD5_9PROT|nr:Rrf2 family transcriptional regulator [Pseudoroseomonas wenyumeiae]RKK04616.1 Rrf2 family transcriptional regulator [Pseudoroseomonas wenyumeiae]RMI17351.1 Rrf2 family transcriptional regulator [Pseudoroseomonas wenyumeiae]